MFLTMWTVLVAFTVARLTLDCCVAEADRYAMNTKKKSARNIRDVIWPTLKCRT